MELFEVVQDGQLVDENEVSLPNVCYPSLDRGVQIKHESNQAGVDETP